MRNTFDLSHEHKTTVELGQLIPIQCDEVLPGDTFNQRSTALTRVAPLQNPLMHRVELRMHTFYAPNRMLHKELVRSPVDLGVTGEWEDFITTEDPAVEQAFYLTSGADPVLDYMGIPPNTSGVEILGYPLAMYNMVWNHFYRDQNLQNERSLYDTTIARCGWQKDYFTIARPDPQLGDRETIPVSGYGRVQETTGTIPDNGAANVTVSTNPDGTRYFGAGVNPGQPTDPMQVQLLGGYIDIDDLRRSLALQRFAEARMRFGSRYVDYLRYIGVNPSDGRLDRPEYLGGGKETLNFSEVLSTADVQTSNVGDMYGHGIGLGRTNGFSKMFEEHGWVMTFLSARPKTVYQNALPKKFTRRDAMDYWQKELETLPWQELKEQEVHNLGDADAVFGYVPKYEEYRHGVSAVSGTMRGGTENDWHLARDFAEPPTLNGSFIECTPDPRIFQDQSMPDLIINVMHDIKARRFVGETASMGVKL